MNTISAIFKIIRPVNILITFLSVVVAGIIALGNNSLSNAIIIAAIAESFAVASGNIINDFFDIEIDKINRPERMLPSGKISTKFALFLYVVFLILSLSFSFWVNPLVFGLMIFTQIVIFLYSFYFKKIILAGNLIVALLVGSAFIFGAAAVGNISGGIIPFVFALLINFCRELLKDIEDIKGDIFMGLSSFPHKFGIEKSKKVISFFISILIGFTFYPYFTGVYNLTYFLIVMIFVNPLLVYFLFRLFKNDSMENLRRLSIILKVGMILGLAAIYFGVVN